jgi:hypothetical protein
MEMNSGSNGHELYVECGGQGSGDWQWKLMQAGEWVSAQ